MNVPSGPLTRPLWWTPLRSRSRTPRRSRTPPPAALPPSPAAQPLQRPPVAPKYGPLTSMQNAVQFAPWVDIDLDYEEEKKQKFLRISQL